jgi:ribosomal protein L5
MSFDLQKYKKRSVFQRLFIYKNVQQISFTIEKLSLFYALKGNLTAKSLIKVSSVLRLISGQRPSFIRSKKTSAFLKTRKGAPSGVKVTLRNKSAISFLLILIWQILPNIKNLPKNKDFLKEKEEHCNSLMFVIPDPMLFNELKPFFFSFKDCPNLRILITFSQKSKKEELYLNGRFSLLPLF